MPAYNPEPQVVYVLTYRGEVLRATHDKDFAIQQQAILQRTRTQPVRLTMVRLEGGAK